MLDAITTFQNVVKGRNFFTPRVLGWYKIENGAIELSTVKSNQPRGITESGFMEDVYGVTVVLNGVYDSERSKIFDSFEEALGYTLAFRPTQLQYYKRIDAYGTTRLVTEVLT